MTFKVLTADDKVIHRAVVRSANKHGAFLNRRAIREAPNIAPKDPYVNLRSCPSTPKVETVNEEEDDEEVPETEKKEFIRSATEEFQARSRPDDGDEEVILPTIDTKGLIGRTFINDPDDYGEQTRAQIEEVSPTEETTADGQETIFKFRCKVGDKTFDEVMTYNKMLEWCDRDLDKDDMYRIDGIEAHRKKTGAKDQWEILVKWSSGESTWNDMSLTFQDDPITVSLYARKAHLLDTPGWKRCKRYVRKRKTIARMVNQQRLKNFRNRPVYKYGYQVPRNHAEAMFIDEKNGNTKWRDAEKLEMDQLFEYDTFKDLGKNGPTPEGYKKIPCHMVYDVKHDGRHKARFVAGGHRTETPVDSVYSGVVSLPGIRIVSFLAELNDLELWGTDVGNAYLESYTQEKVVFTAGGEFGKFAGHTFVIVKAQYGLKSSGKRWHERLYDVLKGMGFSPSKAEEDIWMKDCGDHYEYIAAYVDDLMIASRDPQAIIDQLEAKPHSFKLKGTGAMSFHLGCDYFRDEDNTLCVGPRKYIEKMSALYEGMFGSRPKTNVSSPIEKNDHPELDTSPLLDADGIKQYQSLIGILQWSITLGRFDIATAVMTMSGYRVAPRQGHLDRLKRICGYLLKMKHGFIRVRTEEPDYSDIPETEYDWARSVYGDVKEQIPRDIPRPLGKRVVLTTYVDANLYHDMVTGRSVTGVLHYLNQTPVGWFTKKQATVETATYGSEFIAAKTAVQQIIAMRNTLRYLGVPIHGPTHMFGDNGSVVTSGSTPHSPLRKRHHALAYHFTREAIASNVVDFRHIPGTVNPADILSKHWGYSQIWPMLQSILFWQGDTTPLLEREDSQPAPPKGSDKSLVKPVETPRTEEKPGVETPVTSENPVPEGLRTKDSVRPSTIARRTPSPTSEKISHDLEDRTVPNT
jgi:hypothetical protein